MSTPDTPNAAVGRPTLLIFTRGAKRERARRRLLPGRLGEIELALHRRGLEAAIAAGRDAGCRILVSSPAPIELPPDVERLPQTGRGFGDRLQRAMSQALARTRGPVLVVGTDAPELGPRHLRRAYDRLRRDRDAVVLGPATDGGFYLLAASRPLARELLATSWCRADTLSSLRREIRRAGRQSLLLEPLADLDRPADLSRWLRTIGTGRRQRSLDRGWWVLLQLVRRAMATLLRLEAPLVIGAPRLAVVTTRSGRAPPRSR